MNKLLVVGDALAIAIITLIGFATHGEVAPSFLPRMAATFFPLTIAWFFLAPWFDLFKPEVISAPGQLWRPALVAVFAAPLAALLRALLLNSAIIPIFVLILGGTSAIGMIIWRAFYLLLPRRS